LEKLGRIVNSRFSSLIRFFFFPFSSLFFEPFPFYLATPNGFAAKFLPPEPEKHPLIPNKTLAIQLAPNLSSPLSIFLMGLMFLQFATTSPSRLGQKFNIDLTLNQVFIE